MKINEILNSSKMLETLIGKSFSIGTNIAPRYHKLKLSILSLESIRGVILPSQYNAFVSSLTNEYNELILIINELIDYINKLGITNDPALTKTLANAERIKDSATNLIQTL